MAAKQDLPRPEAVVLKREPLGAQIAEQLRQDILLGRITPGSPIRQQALCELYGTSRMPVRDALRQLTHEGLILSLPSGHAVVVGLSDEDVRDSFLVEAVVHSRAARRATANATDADYRRLQQLHDRMVEATKREDLSAVADLNWHFHAAINHLARSPKLIAIVRSVSLGIPRDYLVALPDLADRSNTDHAAIIDAMRRRDLDGVEAIVHRHAAEAAQYLIEHLSGKGVLGSAEAE